jgi:hypothetical protein
VWAIVLGGCRPRLTGQGNQPAADRLEPPAFIILLSRKLARDLAMTVPQLPDSEDVFDEMRENAEQLDPLEALRHFLHGRQLQPPLRLCRHDLYRSCNHGRSLGAYSPNCRI